MRLAVNWTNCHAARLHAARDHPTVISSQMTILLMLDEDIKKSTRRKITNGLYYKHVKIVNVNSSIVSKCSFKLSDDPRVIIYDRHRFIVQATRVNCSCLGKLPSGLAFW